MCHRSGRFGLRHFFGLQLPPSQTLFLPTGSKTPDAPLIHLYWSPVKISSHFWPSSVVTAAGQSILFLAASPSLPLCGALQGLFFPGATVSVRQQHLGNIPGLRVRCSFPLVLVLSPLTKQHAMSLTVRPIPLGRGIHLRRDSIKPPTVFASTLLMPLNSTSPSPTTKPDYGVLPPLVRVQCESAAVLREAEREVRKALKGDDAESVMPDDVTEYSHPNSGHQPLPITYYGDGEDRESLGRPAGHQNSHFLYPAENPPTNVRSPFADNNAPSQTGWESEYDKEAPPPTPDASGNADGGMIVKGAPNAVKEVPTSCTRRIWLWAVMACTFWIPSFCSLDNSLQVTVILQYLTNDLLLTASVLPLADLDLVLSYFVL